MQKSSLSPLLGAACIAAALALSACSPTLNWRQVQGSNAPYSVLMPAKPASFSRPVNLDGLQVTMTMTAAEVDDVSYAVGSAELADASQAPHALNAMKTAMVNNIKGTIRKEKVGGVATAPNAIDIEAASADNPPTVLFARFTTKGKWVYQAIILGPEKSVTPEAVDTFFSSFKVN
ncbi:hypothetical protein D3870_01175 [Noviherbaspirillum cavernae]|uniref:DUF1795 domain-containing protein n=1 Tax=Noviherbaspirillum cavernae TaxID=2320862 RepID=A0A418WX57_9BURK|nr:hypothetical protein [Noviherbaspirillum cavernae]RJG04816.1 hypothetical protein D3870_01175 [Noviherbaspirillum cavernae]